MNFSQSIRSMFDLLSPEELVQIELRKTQIELLECETALEDCKAQAPKLRSRVKRLEDLLKGTISVNNVTPIQKKRKSNE